MSEAPAEARALAPIRGESPAVRSYSVSNIELRADTEPDSTTVNFRGHAAVTGKGYEMYGGPDNGGWMEYVDKGAFKRTLEKDPDVAFLLNHEGMTLARTKAGTLDLREDSVGLEATARLDKRVSVVNDIAVLMEAGNLDEMSFAFRIVKQTWLDRDGEEVPWWDMAGVERHIREVNIHKGDVSVVNYGANPFTDASMRSIDTAMSFLTAGCDLSPARLRGAIEHLQSLVGAPEDREPPAMHPDLVEAFYAAQRRLIRS